MTCRPPSTATASPRCAPSACTASNARAAHTSPSVGAPQRIAYFARTGSVTTRSAPEAKKRAVEIDAPSGRRIVSAGREAAAALLASGFLAGEVAPLILNFCLAALQPELRPNGWIIWRDRAGRQIHAALTWENVTTDVLEAALAAREA